MNDLLGPGWFVLRPKLALAQRCALVDEERREVLHVDGPLEPTHRGTLAWVGGFLSGIPAFVIAFVATIWIHPAVSAIAGVAAFFGVAVYVAMRVMGLRDEISFYEDAARSRRLLNVRRERVGLVEKQRFVVLDEAGEELAHLTAEGSTVPDTARTLDGRLAASATEEAEPALKPEVVARYGLASDRLGQAYIVVREGDTIVLTLRRRSDLLGGALLEIRPADRGGEDVRLALALAIAVEMLLARRDAGPGGPMLGW